jgi:hypothetical protein
VPTFEELERRVSDLEALVRGDIAIGQVGQIDHRSLPMADIARALEASASTREGRTLLTERSVTTREHGKVPYARLKSTLVQSVPNSTHTKINFNGVVSDNFDQVNLTAQPSRITFRVPGVYVVTGVVAFDMTAATQLMKASILVNAGGVYVNTAEINGVEFKVAAAGIQAIQVTTVRHFQVDDHVELYGLHVIGAAANVYQEGATNERYPSLAACWIGNF